MAGNEQELKGQGAGAAPETGAATGTQAQAAIQGAALRQAQGEGEGAQAQATGAALRQAQGEMSSGGINLDEVPEFRNWKGKMDRRLAEAAKAAQAERQRAAQMEAQLQAMQQQFDQQRLANAEPEEVAQFYQSRMAEVERRTQEQTARIQLEREVTDYVGAQLAELGIDPLDPRLTWPEDKTWQNAADVLAQAARLRTVQASEQEKAAQAAAAEAAHAAKVQALQEAGVTHVTTTPGAAPSLQAEYDRERAALKHSGRIEEALALRRKYREKGLDV